MESPTARRHGGLVARGKDKRSTVYSTNPNSSLLVYIGNLGKEAQGLASAGSQGDGRGAKPIRYKLHGGLVSE